MMLFMCDSSFWVRQLLWTGDEGLTLFEDSPMLWTIALILLILWAVGAFIVPFGGGLIHLLLVIALIVVVYRLITGRPVV